MAEDYNTFIRDFNAHSYTSSLRQLPEQTPDEIKSRFFAKNRIPEPLPWTVKEDEAFRNHVIQYGNGEWEQCAKALPDSGKRTAKECSKHYIYCLHARNHGPWTKAEDRLIEEKYAEFEDEWEKIALFLDGRSPLQISKRHSRLTGINPPAREWVDHGIFRQPHYSDVSEEEEEDSEKDNENS